MDKPNREINAESRFDEFHQFLTKEMGYSQYNRDEHWLFRKDLEPEINSAFFK